MSAPILNATRSQGYNYDTFTRQIFRQELHFHGGPAPDQPAPDFQLPTVDGGWFRLRDCRGKKPVLIEFGCIT